jgi:hypothetical protein
MLPLPLPSPKTRPRKSMAYSQATEIQDLLRESAHDPKMKGVPLASLARAWLELERLKREIRMQPKPKPIDVVPKSRKVKQGFADPVERTAVRTPPLAAAPEPTEPPAPPEASAPPLPPS